MSELESIDVVHVGSPRVICCHKVDGDLVDPGPTASVHTLLEALGDDVPQRLLLTHIHLDHAGAAGYLVRKWPHLEVWVSEVGAPHLVDPSKLVNSATRLYGDDMDRLWGEIVPVPQENIRTFTGGEAVDGWRVAATPGHASHHVAYLREDEGWAFVGDVAGVRIIPGYITPPTPPPDVDLEAWQASLDLVAAWKPSLLALTHFGTYDDVESHIERLRGAIVELGRAREGHRRGRFRRRAAGRGELRGGPCDAAFDGRRGAARDSSGRVSIGTGARRPSGRPRRNDRATIPPVSQTVELPRTAGPGSGLGGEWRVIVRNDDHNTFDHVAHTLARDASRRERRRGLPLRRPDPQHRPGDRVERATRSRRALLGATASKRASPWPPSSRD